MLMIDAFRDKAARGHRKLISYSSNLIAFSLPVSPQVYYGAPGTKIGPLPSC